MTSQHSKRHVSPRAPGHSLERALEDCMILFEKKQQLSFSAETCARHLGMRPYTGSFNRRLASMKYYGLMSGPARNGLHVTELFLRIAYPAQGEQSRLAALREALKAPSLFSRLFDEFEISGLPSKEGLTSRLIKDGFTRGNAERVAGAFLASAKYAGFFGEQEGQAVPGSSPGMDGTETLHLGPGTLSPGVPQAISIPLARARRILIRYPEDLSKDEIDKVARVLRTLLSEEEASGATPTASFNVGTNTDSELEDDQRQGGEKQM